MPNVNLFPEIDIPEKDLQSAPKSVRDFLLFLVEEHGFLREQVTTLIEEKNSLVRTIEELKVRLGKNSSNSNKPPSSDNPFVKDRGKKAKEKEQKGKPGAKPGHEGHRQRLLPPTYEESVEPTVCTCGCTEIKNSRPYYVHQEFELPEIKTDVRHYILKEGECAHCGRTVKGSVPVGHHTGFGPRLSGLIAELTGVNGDSRETVHQFCRSVLGVEISIGGIQNVIDRVSESIVPHYEKIGETVMEEEVNHVDETSWKLLGNLNWLWVMANTMVVFFMVHKNRSMEAFKELVKNRTGIPVCDGYSVYQNWVGLRQTCLAHLIRKAGSLEESADGEISRMGVRAGKELQRLCRMGKVKPSKGEWLAFYARFTHLIVRYRDCDNEAGKFARRLAREMEHLFLFLKKEGVEPTNNYAERMLRYAVLWRKRSQGTRSQKGNRWIERILSLRQTCRLKGKSSFEVLVEAVDSFLNNQTPDLSWIDQKSTP